MEEPQETVEEVYEVEDIEQMSEEADEGEEYQEEQDEILEDGQDEGLEYEEEEELIEAEGDELTDVSPASVEIAVETVTDQIERAPEMMMMMTTATSGNSDMIVEVDQSDEVVGMMIDKLTSKFPPETVVTVSSGTVEGGHFKESSESYRELVGQSSILSTSGHAIYSSLPQSEMTTTTTTTADRALLRPIAEGQNVNVHTSVMPGHALGWQQSRQQIVNTGASIAHSQSAYQQQQLGGNIYMSVSGGSGHVYETVQQVQQVTGKYEEQQQQRVQSTASFGEQSIVSQRIVSSTVLNEKELSAPQEEKVTYLEVPVVEYKEVFVTKKQIVEIEKRVPRVETEWVERVVEIPQIEYVERVVEVPRVEEIIRHVPRKEIIEVPKEFIRHVPKIETRIVEQIIEVPEIIERVVPQIIEQKVEVAQYRDTETPTIVAQTINSVVKEAGTTHPVEANKYEPRLVAVDVFVPLPIQMGGFVGIQKMEERHQVVDVPAAHYNSLVKELNTHIELREHQTSLPLLQEHSGHIPFLPVGEKIDIVQPQNSEWQSTYTSNKIYCHEMMNHKVINRTSDTVSKTTSGGYVTGNRGVTTSLDKFQSSASHGTSFPTNFSGTETRTGGYSTGISNGYTSVTTSYGAQTGLNSGSGLTTGLSTGAPRTVYGTSTTTSKPYSTTVNTSSLPQSSMPRAAMESPFFSY